MTARDGKQWKVIHHLLPDAPTTRTLTNLAVRVALAPPSFSTQSNYRLPSSTVHHFTANQTQEGSTL